MNKKSIQIIAFALFALLAFAGNSVLCRLALGQNSIDAASFTVIRLLSGMIMLTALMNITRNSDQNPSRGNWLAASMLFIYATAFSFGYLSLDTGTGALILFGTVQITMITASVISGNRLHFSDWLGLFIAFSGFIYLVIPSLTTPSSMGFILMIISGIAWGGYTLLGISSKNPLNDTAYNFLRTSPFVLMLIVFTFNNLNLTSEGILLAVLSGAVASGLGYFIWYVALRRLAVTQAAVIQLFVPVIAAIGGVVFTSEKMTLRLAESSILVLGGVLIVILGKKYFSPSKSKNT